MNDTVTVPPYLKYIVIGILLHQNWHLERFGGLWVLPNHLNTFSDPKGLSATE